jgi:protein involved in polysaccharide export with SLBB domain
VLGAHLLQFAENLTTYRYIPYQLEQLTTAIQAIAMAGGFTDKAAPNRTKIIRTHPDGRQETLIADLNEVIKRGRKEKDPPIAANDIIIVPESFF